MVGNRYKFYKIVVVCYNIGFPENTIVPKNTKSKSPFVVDINRGLRYVTLGCNCVNTDRNFETHGNPSRVFARIPITTEQSLNESVTLYDNIQQRVTTFVRAHARTTLRKIASNFALKPNIKVQSSTNNCG